MSVKRAASIKTGQSLMKSWLATSTTTTTTTRPHKRQRTEEPDREEDNSNTTGNAAIKEPEGVDPPQDHTTIPTTNKDVEMPPKSWAQIAADAKDDSKPNSNPASESMSSPYFSDGNRPAIQANARKPQPTNNASAASTTTPSTTEKDATNTTTAPRKTLKVEEITADIFDAPDNAVIIHACNCYGHWGAGIAAAFKSLYPTAHSTHSRYCKTRDVEQLIGTAQLISPSSSKDDQHYVGCLFTSKKFGRYKDSPKDILAATGPAMRDLMKQMKDVVRKGGEISEIRICQINSGLFKVPWEKTKEVLEGIEVVEGLPEEITCYIRP